MFSASEEIYTYFTPKKYIQQEEFLQRYPKYDGRGLLIAIIDSGIDVSLDGMQKTSTGLPKILDCFDFSGTGDVDTSVIRKTEKDNNLLLLSGKKVKIPQSWKNPLKEWHLGIKSWNKIYPEMLTNIVNPEEKTDKENLIEEKISENFKPVENLNETKHLLDCIVWNNGKKWCACIVSGSAINLENVKILTNFRDEHEYCFISENLCCCITIKNDGNLLELFIPYCTHGSCVAQVAAAHYPDHPEKDGLAPGAQIVSMSIFNECDNTTKIETALNKCIELGVDMVNISFSTPDFSKSAIINLFIKKMVNKLGIIITQAAGNLGPFISSVRTDTNKCDDEMLTVGSLFTSDMHSLIRKENDDNSRSSLWFYSSKGPLPNGARGVTFVAPGGAIVENPRWYSSKKHFFHGTSCASPIAAGAIACLLSALKANSIQYTPSMIKMVLSNTAFLPDGGDKLGFGNGIIKINSAFEYFKTFKTDLQKAVLPQIFINKSIKKGIVLYILNNNSMKKYCIKTENVQKQISWIIKLTPEESHKHIEYSKTIKNNSFYVTIHSKELKPGRHYYSEIHGFDSSNLSMGPLFHFPITIIVPVNVDNYIEREIFLTPLSLFNLFINPDKRYKSCTVKLQDSENENGETHFQNTINYNNLCNTEQRIEFTFCPNGASCSWVIQIRWQTVFEIYVYQELFSKKDFALKSFLTIFFEE